MAQKKTLKKHTRLAVYVVPVLIAIVGVVLWLVPLAAPDLPEPPLKDLAAKHDIALGSRVVSERINDRIYPDLIASQYDYYSIFAETHFDLIRPEKNQYDFSELDTLVDYSRDQGKPVHMFHLMWGEENHFPSWLTQGGFSTDELREIAKDHVTNVAAHYKGRALSWSVANEVFTRSQHVYGLNDWWADQLGENRHYVDDAFLAARQADPNAKLLLNDFKNEGINSISNAMYDYTKSAKERGIPIDGLGMQMHINAAKPPQKDDVIENMRRFGELGVPTYVTEFDVNLNSVEGSDEYKRELEAEVTYNMVRACVESGNCVSFTEFGTTDKNELFKKITNAGSHSFLFDSKFWPKPSYYSFRQAWLEP